MHATNKGRDLDFKQFLTVLGRRWMSIVSIILIALGVSSVITFTRTPMYESKTQIFLTVDVRDTTDAYAALLFASNRAASYANVVKSTNLAELVKKDLKLKMSAEELASRFDAKVVESTSLIQISYRDENPNDARMIANYATERFNEYVAGLETPGAVTDDSGTTTSGSAQESQIRAQVTDKATVATQVTPNVVLNLAPPS